MNEPPKQRAQERQQLLATFDLITEEQLAMLLGVEVKTLKNRDQRDLPAFSKVGNKRLFFKADVVKYLRAAPTTDSTMPRLSRGDAPTRRSDMSTRWSLPQVCVWIATGDAAKA